MKTPKGGSALGITLKANWWVPSMRSPVLSGYLFQENAPCEQAVSQRSCRPGCPKGSHRSLPASPPQRTQAPTSLPDQCPTGNLRSYFHRGNPISSLGRSSQPSSWVTWGPWNFLTPTIFTSALIPWQHAPRTLFLAFRAVARTLSGTAGHETKRGAPWEDTVTGLLQSAADREGQWRWHWCGRETSDPAVNMWPGFWWGGRVLRRGSATEPQEGSRTLCHPTSAYH